MPSGLFLKLDKNINFIWKDNNKENLEKEEHWGWGEGSTGQGASLESKVDQ